MTPLELFGRLAPLVGPQLEQQWNRRDLCVMATAVAIEVGAYFGIDVRPQPCRCMVYNAAFATHLNEEPIDVKRWQSLDGSYSVGLGCGFADGRDTTGRWNGHLIAVAEGHFGDFTIWQAERPQWNIVLGEAIVGPFDGAKRWGARNGHGVGVEYELTDNQTFRRGPDWRDKNRRRRLVGKLIRTLRKENE